MSTTITQGQKPASSLDSGALLVFATVLFGLSVRASSPKAGLAVAFATLLCGVALRMVSRGKRATQNIRPRTHEARLFLAILVFAGFGMAGWAPWSREDESLLLERLPFAIWGALACWLYFKRHDGARRAHFAAIVGLTLLLTMVVGVLHLNNTRDWGVDVFWLHRGAAEAIADGENPYSDAVQVANGAPTSSPGDMIVGYPYPPVTALAYSVGEWTTGDARYTSLAAWVGFLGVVGYVGFRRRSRDHLYVMLLLASIPGWSLVLRAGWTEPFSLLLLVVAFVTWRLPSQSGAFLGLGLASKQYFAATLPVLLLHRDRGWKHRLGVAAVLVAVTIVPVVLLDPAAFWNAAVEFHLNTPVRRDSVNVTGVFAAFGGSWLPPRWLGPIVGIIVGFAAGRVSRDARTFFISMGLTLATVFLFASQALANYWFLIAGLVALALLTDRSGPSDLGQERAVNRSSSIP